MKKATAILVMLLVFCAEAWSSDNVYQVTITNLTRGQTFTPILVASHRSGVSLFETGASAGEEISAIAEGGDVVPLSEVLDANKKVAEVKNSGGTLPPGESVTVEVSARGANRISLAAMLVPTNDTFVALRDVRAPRFGSVTYRAVAYDAGSETNNEECDSIPAGGECAGEGVSLDDDGEGFVHISAGIHGIGDLTPETYDWRNPVADVTITRKR